jgi:CRP/FNR family nitrogen fixation transcriptional regulator
MRLRTIVAVYPRRRLEMMADQDPLLAREIRGVVFNVLSRLQAQLMTVGRVIAIEKVGSFLIEMARRQSKGAVDRVMLPISRYDLADYLRLSVETVSRTMTSLKQRGVITFSGTRSIRIMDRNALDNGQRDAQVPAIQSHAGRVRCQKDACSRSRRAMEAFAPRT